MFSEYRRHPEMNGHELLVRHVDPVTGLHAIIAIHSTFRGPALGGCRMYPYANEMDAVTDVLRLSRGMTYKAAISNLGLGGGKMVIIGDPKKIKSRALFHEAGRFVDSLCGWYISGEDVGMTPDDCKMMAEVTPYVGGTAVTPYDGNPSPTTALGVYMAISAALKAYNGETMLHGVTCAVEGLGNVGFPLAKRLRESGAIVIASDLDPERLKRAQREFGVVPVSTEVLRMVNADIYVPCAMGGVIDDKMIDNLKVGIVCGSANNILARPEHGEQLRARGILCVPDYVANCGGLIDIFYQRAGYDLEKVNEHVRCIAYDLVLKILCRAKDEQRTPQAVADEIAELRFRRS